MTDALRLCVSLPVRRLYWSEKWIDVADLLKSVADRLQEQRAVREIELDSGWWEDRDVTVSNRTWFRLDVRGLIEDHGGGQCLYRFAVRPRLSRAVALPLLYASAATAIVWYAGFPWRSAVSVVAVAVVALAAYSVLAISRVTLSALDRVATEMGMLRIDAERSRREVAPAVPVAAEPAGLRLTTRGAAEQPAPPGDLVGDLPGP